MDCISILVALLGAGHHRIQVRQVLDRGQIRLGEVGDRDRSVWQYVAQKLPGERTGHPGKGSTLSSGSGMAAGNDGHRSGLECGGASSRTDQQVVVIGSGERQHRHLHCGDLR